MRAFSTSALLALTLLLAAALLLAISFAHAQYDIQATEADSREDAANPEWSDYNVSDPGATDEGSSDSAGTQQGRTGLDSDANEGDGYDEPGNTIQTVEPSTESTGIEHEDIGAPAADDARGGTEDINIGVGELDEAQHNETDLEFLHDRASDVSVSAVEVRGWDPEQKEAHLGAVKDHAEVASGQDLEHFAQGVLLMHDEVERIETGTSSVAVEYRVPAKLFGIFNTSIRQETSIQFGDGEHGRVSVRFPWFRFLYNVDDRFSADAVEETLMPEVDDEVLTAFGEGDTPPAVHASIIQRVVDLFAQ